MTPRHSAERCCRYCGATLVKRKGETPYALRQRVYCNRDCHFKHNAAQSIQTELRNQRRCLHCHRVLVRREGEQNTNFIRRGHCDQKCAHARVNGHPLDVSKLNPIVRPRSMPSAESKPVATPVKGKRRMKPAKRVMPQFLQALDEETRRLFLEAIEVHPDFVRAFTNDRSFEYSDELRAGDFLRTT